MCHDRSIQLLRSASLIIALGMRVCASSVSIDADVSYQTIDGFGGFGGVIAEYASGPQYTDAWVDLIANDLGLSIHRYFLNPNDLEPVNDNADPFNTNLAAFNVAGGRLGGQIPLLTRLKAAGVATFFFSILSPPYWMKQGPYHEWCYTGGDCSCCGGTLREDMYDEFAEFCAAYVRLTRDAGIDLYALSVQNEPRFSEPYPACVYSNTQLRDMVKKVGARLHSAGLSSTTLMVAEDVLSSFGVLEGAVMADSTARSYVGVLATHAYQEDGVLPTLASGAAQQWVAAKRKMNATGLPFWMTETSGYANSWSGAYTLATGIYSALQYGNVSGWVYYRLGGAEDALTNLGQPTWLFYGAKQYFRYVRPGARRVSCVVEDTTILAQAFVHGANRTLTVVLFNHSDAPKTVMLSGTAAASFAAHRSSATERCASLGAVSMPQVELPARSITTLYGTGFEYSSAAAWSPATPLGYAVGAIGTRSVLIYDLRGRMVKVPLGARPSPGVYGVPAERGHQAGLQLHPGVGR